MNILITGAKGQLGTFLSRELSKKHNVISASSKEVDITDFDNVKKAVKNINIIINCAAFTNVKAAETDPLNFKVNEEGTKNIVDSLTSNQKFIHISSLSVFPPDANKDKRFNDNLNTNIFPKQNYGKSKSLADKYIIENMKNNFLIIRPSWLHSCGKTNFLSKVNSFESNVKKIAHDNIGQFTSGSMILRVIEYNINKWVGGEINVATREVISRYDLYNEYLKLKNINQKIEKVSMEEFGFKKEELNYQLMNVEKLESMNILNSFKEELKIWIEKEEVE